MEEKCMRVSDRGAENEITTRRSSNIEVLRILAILMIVSFHCAYHSGFTYSSFSFNVFTVKSFYFLGELGVNLFFLISGYFIVNKGFRFKKFLLLEFEFVFYIILSALIAHLLTGSAYHPLRLFVSFLLPDYWFFLAYILLYLFSPYLNKALTMLSRAELVKLLVLCWLVWSILPTLLGGINAGNTERIYYFNRFIWAVVMYCTGAGISLHSIGWVKRKRVSLLLIILCSLIMLLSIWVIGAQKELFSGLGISEPAYFWQINTFPLGILSISIFNLFIKWDIGSNRVLNRISSTTLGIYLLTDGQLRPIIWNEILHAKEQLSHSAIHSLGFLILIPILIVAAAAVVDLIRQLLETYTIKKILASEKTDKLLEDMKSKIESVLQSL